MTAAPPPLASAFPALGARVGSGGVDFRVWAPSQQQLRLRLRRRDGTHQVVLNLDRAPDGYHVARDPDGRDGNRYLFELADGSLAPDPASRYQPEGVHGPSECVNSRHYRWRCRTWRRPPWRDQVIYELHVGTFTAAGTYDAAIDRLDHIRALGATAIELMPLADFSGSRNWGYDGVALYAPARCYGHPDELRGLVDSAHERGLAVILDVVYNHLGPEGNYLPRFSSQYYHPSHRTPWGPAFNLDGPQAQPVRDFLVGNAAYWLDEFRFDGLRLDATHAIRDDSSRHLVADLAAAAHARGAFVMAEDERNAAELITPARDGGLGVDAAWSDDFHHQIRVALTGARRSYFASYDGSADAIARTLARGWYYEGQGFPFWEGRPRGSDASALPASAFVACIENHDQVGNLPRGERLEHLVPGAAFRAASMLLLLNPHPPMLFMGQEWAASSPFLYFTDHPGPLGQAVSEGRRREFPDFTAAGGDGIPDPQDPETFQRSKLRWEERAAPSHAGVLALYQACLRERAGWLRRALALGRWEARALGETVVIRYRPPAEADRLVVAALRSGPSLPWDQEPFLRPPDGQVWRTTLQSDGGAAPAPLRAVSSPFAVLLTAVPG